MTGSLFRTFGKSYFKCTHGSGYPYRAFVSKLLVPSAQPRGFTFRGSGLRVRPATRRSGGGRPAGLHPRSSGLGDPRLALGS